VAGADSGAERVFRGALQAAANEVGIPLSDIALERMLEHYGLLVQWNRRVNLTRVRDPREVAVRHFGESLFLARELGGPPEKLLDVGSGAGFPGLPLAALWPATRVTLLESVQRKAVFLREVSRSWGNVEVRNERLEGLRGGWTVSTMRAVAASGAVPHLARVSERVAILTGEEGVEEACRAGGFDWEAPLRLPWGERRFLLQGRRPASS